MNTNVTVKIDDEVWERFIEPNKSGGVTKMGDKSYLEKIRSVLEEALNHINERLLTFDNTES